MKNAQFSMMQYTHNSYQPAESRKDFGRFAASIENWSRVLGTWRVEEDRKKTITHIGF